MSLSERLAKLKAQNGLTTEYLSEQSGVPIGTINKILNGETQNPTGKTLRKLAEALGSSVEFLYSGNASREISIPKGFEPLPRMKKAPMLGTIACGEPLMELDDASEFYDVDESVHADFCLRCKGDSMIGARILNGDVVFIRSQPDVESGEIAAVEVNGEATLKRVYKFCVGGRLRALELRAENPSEPIRTYEGDELNAVRIVGKAVAFTSHVR